MILEVRSGQQTEMIDITNKVRQAIRESGIESGLCMIYVPHTTAAVTINENADPSVPRDILMMLDRLVPREADYRHGEGNSPADVKSTLVGASQLIAVEEGEPVLGTWQGIFFCEFDGPRSRKVHVRILPGKTGAVP